MFAKFLKAPTIRIAPKRPFHNGHTLVGIHISKPPPKHHGVITKFNQEYSVWLVEYAEHAECEYINLFDLCDFVPDYDRGFVDKYLETLD